MHRAGIAWPQALASASQSDPTWLDAHRRLEQGQGIAASLEGAVDPLDRALLEAGERNGALEQTFEELAETHDERHRRREEARVRQMYPFVLSHILAVLMALPDLLQGRLLPAVGWALLILVPLWAWIFLQSVLARPERPLCDARPPAPPPMIAALRNRTQEADARGLEALGRLYDAGVPLDQALALSVSAGWGGRVALDLFDARARVAAGHDLSGAFTHLPAPIPGRLRSAEDSGSLGRTLVQIAREMRYDADVRRRKAAQTVPVIMLLVIAVLVFLRLAVFYGGYFEQVNRLLQ